MKLIKTGKTKPWSIRKSCSGNGNGGKGCGAILEIEADDLYVTRSSDTEGDLCYYTFTCPECRTLTDLEVFPPVYVCDTVLSRREWQEVNKEDRRERVIALAEGLGRAFAEIGYETEEVQEALREAHKFIGKDVALFKEFSFILYKTIADLDFYDE